MSDEKSRFPHQREETDLPRDTPSPSQFQLDRLEQVIAEKDAENSRLRGEVIRLHAEAARLDRQVARFLKLNEKLEAENERLSSKNDSNDASVTKAMDELKIEQDAKAQLREELSKASAELNKCQEQNTSLESQLKEHEDQINDLTHQLNTAKSQEAEKVQISGKLDKALKEIYYWRCMDRWHTVSEAALRKHTGYHSGLYAGQPFRYSLTKDGKEVYGMPIKHVINDLPHLVRDYGLEHLSWAVIEVHNKGQALSNDFNWEMRHQFLDLLEYKDPSQN